MTNNKYTIPEEIRQDYLERLNEKNEKITGKNHTYYDHFMKGGGQELKAKFWSTKSSARLCFDLYSWMAESPDIVSICFEKKLPGIFSGARKTEIKSNMDAYFETTTDIYFIESKYTETVYNHHFKEKRLPQAYSETSNVYKNTKGEDTILSIKERYHNAIVQKSFLEFIEKVDDKTSKLKGKNWFDAKQEICHLLGITYFAIEQRPRKNIHFMNIAANYSFSKFPEYFRSEAEKRVKNILRQHGVMASFDYKLHSVKEYFERFKLLDHRGYKSQKTIREIISDKSLYEVPII